KRKDYRTRKDRVERQIQAWKSVLPHLVNAFLKFQSQGLPTRNAEGRNQVPWTIEVISLEGRGHRLFLFTTDATSAAVTLVESGIIPVSPDQPRLGFTIESLRFYRQLRRSGIIPVSPDQPRLGFTIESLRFYRQLRCVCPRFSINAFAKALDFYHAIPHMPYLADQLSNAYDCYLEIIQAVKKIVSAELKRGESWDTQNICPPCLYEVEDEPPLKFRLLAIMDGNNSLKLVDSVFRTGSVRTDTRKSTSRCWISSEEVDLFKEEVKKVCLNISHV
ncbi:hypothetical protein CVT25_007989, partial [Psilocybe cyanescens]